MTRAERIQALTTPLPDIDSTKRKGSSMARTSDATTATLADALALTDICEHPLVQPVDAQLHALRVRREEVTEALKSIIMRLRELNEQPSSPAQRRACQEQMSRLQEEQEEVEFQIRALQPAIDAAKSEARATLKPALRAEAIRLLGALSEAMTTVAEITAQAQDFDRHVHRLLGISLVGAALDTAVAARLKALDQQIDYLSR
jgi:chromosome segregation ATPase